LVNQIFYYNPHQEYFNIIIISDGYNGSYWNDGDNFNPVVAVAPHGNVQVVWYDLSSGYWGSDIEIMHVEVENQYKPKTTPLSIPFGHNYLIYLILGFPILSKVVKKKIKK